MKPKLTAADQEAYRRMESLPVGTKLTIDGKKGKFEGMTGYLITVSVNNRLHYLRAGDPLIRELASSFR